MGNRDTESARTYHEATKHSYHSVRSDPHFLDWENKPLPYKVYPNLPTVPLPREFPPLAADAFSAAGAFSIHRTSVHRTAAPGGAGASLDLPTLARLLFFSAGVTKKIRFGGQDFYFRAAACAGALYPVEVYLVAGEVEGLPAGVYHFSPGDFVLRRLREGDWRGALAKAAGGQAAPGAEPAFLSPPPEAGLQQSGHPRTGSVAGGEAIARAPATAVLTAIFWRSAWKYRARCYRYCFWDAGMILANLLAVAAAGGQPAQVLAGFADTQVDLLLGLDGEKEVSLCVVPLGEAAAGGSPPSARPAPPPIAPEVIPLSEREVEYPAIRAMHEASCLVEEQEVRAWREGATRRPERAHEEPEVGGGILLSPPSTPSPTSLLEVIQRRGSSREFARKAISLEELSAILSFSSRGVPADFLSAPGESLLDLYLVVNAVEGLPPGSYYLRSVDRPPDGKGLVRLAEGNFRREAGHICLEQALAADASAVVFFLADLEAALERFGNRGYRAAQLEAGTVGGKLYLTAYAQGLGATGLTFYDDEMAEFFSPHSRGKDAILVVALGVPAGVKRAG